MAKAKTNDGDASNHGNGPRNENDVRDWFSKWYANGISKGKPGITWIEFALGGSPGAPDALVPIDKILVPAELKHGEFRGSDGALLVKFRPAQINWHAEMAAFGVKTYVFIGTRMGVFCVRGRDVKRFASGECVAWPEIANGVAGEINGFFSMMADEAQSIESIENYKKNVVRIELAMANSRKKMAPAIAKPAKSVSKRHGITTRAAKSLEPQTYHHRSSHTDEARAKVALINLLPLSNLKKAKAAWPKPNAIATKSKTAPRTPAKLARSPAAKPTARSIRAPAKASRA